MKTNNVDYKHFTYEVISSLKMKIDILRDMDKSTINSDVFEGIKLAYHYVMSDLIFLANEFEIDLSEFGIDDFDDNDILEL
jgi:hypothetical protein